MVVPLVMLLILAFVVIRSLMVVVGREEEMSATNAAAESAGMPGMPAPQLRARADDGVRGLLLPAVADMEFVDDPAHSDAP